MNQLNENNYPEIKKTEEEPSNFIEWKFQLNEKSGELEFESAELSDGSTLNEENFKKAIKKASGTSDPIIGERILKKVARGLSSDGFDQRLNEASALLPSLNPKNATEALLLGQFLALQDSGMKCLRQANSQDMFYHIEKLFTLATKLFNTANQTMQSLAKYRSGGQQTVQVLHVHNEGQAVVAQNLSQSSKGGSKKKNSNEPHGSL
ncbi:MAG: hypothetical protein P0S96_04695 [Simkaniaceae bacterium]|nr:hypothetical protein [Candidatus Sacchlamyda saccharinae]